MSDKQIDLHTIRHSAEHIMHQAIKELFPKVHLAMGPSTDDGFYCDFDPNGEKVTEEDFPRIEKRMRELMDLDLPITKVEITEKEARELFKDNPYKLEWISDFSKDNQKLTVYWTGKSGEKNSMVDLCRGPHVASTKQVGIVKLLSIAGAYWHGDEKNKMLTRIYGTAFPTQEELDKYLWQLEEAKKRDHKKLGPQLGLFFIDETAPGMPYWLPKGTIVYNQLLNFWRTEHAKRGYLETITPLINKKQLYVKSGHWDHYKENMFVADMKEDGVYCLKPMNCPNAMTIYQSTLHSYKEFPLRLSDCDTLHRFERSGQMNGLLRVRKFSQDDAHIFVNEDLIETEYRNIFEILKLFYGIFDIKFRIRLGTSPNDFMGDIETWKKAENYLRKIIDKSGFDYFIGEGEGAFYGPKLDILMEDFMGREWQTGTIQLDFQMPKNFNLKYTDQDGIEKTPVVIHRVIYGSLERFIGILIEHYAGAFPVWLAPEQVIILPVSDKSMEYAHLCESVLKSAEIRVSVDERPERLQAKIRDAEMQKIPYMLIVGPKEAETNSVSVRLRGERDKGSMKLDDFARLVKEDIETKRQI